MKKQFALLLLPATNISCKKMEYNLVSSKWRIYRSLFLILSCLLLFMSQVNGQRSYLSFKVSYPFLGTPRELKSGMRKAGFNSTATFIFTKHHPYSATYPSVVAEWGKYINEKRSFSILAGLQEAGYVDGYNTYKGSIKIEYKNWVVNPKFNFHLPSAILGVGPSALMLVYKRKWPSTDDYHHTRIVPGVSFAAETVTKKKKGFRMGLFTALNVHPSFDIEPMEVRSNSGVSTFNSSINPTSLQIGLRFRFQK